ncbi:MAG TPA: beta-eliminating lyase-related protein [Xanthobacteraceae bacterium]|nr:beta-eliminating lyase-related protein [Xanthobacteraceae bacterium]
MNFASDNAAGVARAILDALHRVNEGHVLGYGNDPVTRAVRERLQDIFGCDLAAYLVGTGTAANALALAHLSPPWGAVLCHRDAHIATSEAGAPEFFGGGLKLVTLDGEGGKLTPQGLTAALDGAEWGGPHHVTPSVLSLTQVTEAGTIYQPQEIAALAQIAHARGMAVHMDGARFANAVAALGVPPAQASWQCGVDVLSFGATKCGAMAAEAVIFFDPSRAAGMDERRKRAGHLFSKHRFVAAQFDAFLAGDLWLALARHANAMAARLGKGLAAIGIEPVWPVEANLVFALLPAEAHARLGHAGARYYEMRSRALPRQAAQPPGAVLVRLVTSFATSEDEVDRFVAAAAG